MSKNTLSWDEVANVILGTGHCPYCGEAVILPSEGRQRTHRCRALATVPEGVGVAERIGNETPKTRWAWLSAWAKGQLYRNWWVAVGYAGSVEKFLLLASGESGNTNDWRVVAYEPGG